MTQNNSDKLKQLAQQAATRAHAPYSNFPVGAALQLASGEVILGCNVENVSYGLSNCAERTAIFSAIAQGYDPSQITEVVVFTPGQKVHAPCGACRQVMAEFLPQQTALTSACEDDQKTWTIAELLPDAFTFDQAEYRNID